jgi:hypothetical protein
VFRAPIRLAIANRGPWFHDAPATTRVSESRGAAVSEIVRSKRRPGRVDEILHPFRGRMRRERSEPFAVDTLFFKLALFRPASFGKRGKVIQMDFIRFLICISDWIQGGPFK